jgi:hypothetical protein
LRGSLLTSSPRLAIKPANAILNYLYAILEAETRLACLTLGLDPGLGIVHADHRDRDSFALDLMEAPDQPSTPTSSSSSELAGSRGEPSPRPGAASAVSTRRLVMSSPKPPPAGQKQSRRPPRLSPNCSRAAMAPRSSRLRRR